MAASPRPLLKTTGDAEVLAHRLAGSLPDAFVVRGLGDSMLPLYRSGTILVVQRQAYDHLTRGMTVVFHTSDRTIAHVLVARTGDGWRTAGLHNRQPDYLQVNDRNIVGVVVAAFTPIEGASFAMR
ncbi:MAG: S24/S26 family peptidase [Opitutales bacterium]